MITTQPGGPADTPLRVVWGLVADRYDVAAKTPSLTQDQALLLSRVPDMGDPSAPLDDAVAYLVSDTWGTVCARYYTDSRRDSAGRLVLVYDVVRPSVEQFREARCNPFLVFPALAANHSLPAEGDLPSPSQCSAIDESARLTHLLAEESGDAVVELLSAILGEGPVLFASRESLMRRIECVTLILPSPLRGRFTFQSYALNPSTHEPLLTVSPQGISAPRKGKWSCVLPRDAGTIAPASRGAASALLTIATNGRRFEIVEAAFEKQYADSAETLLDGAQRFVRTDQYLASIDTGDVEESLRIMSSAIHTGEREFMTSALASARTAAEIAEGAAGLIELDPEPGWRSVRQILSAGGASATVATELARRLCRVDLGDAERAGPSRSLSRGVQATTGSGRQFYNAGDALTDDTLADGTPADGTPPDDMFFVRTVLAGYAANADLTDAFLLLAPPVAHRDAARSLSTSGGSPLGGLARSLFVDQAGGAERAIAILAALEKVAPQIKTKRARSRASALGLGAIRSTLSDGGAAIPAVASRLRGAVLSFWKSYEAESQGDRDLPALLAGRGGEDGLAARRVAQSVSRDSRGANELIGWAKLLMSAEGETLPGAAVQLLEEGKSIPGFTAAASAFVRSLPLLGQVGELTPEWIRLLKLTDRATATEIANEVLERSIERVAAGDGVGAVADTCVALAALGVSLDRPRAAQVGRALLQLSERLDHTDAALKLRLCYSALENVADADFIEAIDALLWEAPRSSTVLAGWLRIVASSYVRIERVREINAYLALSERVQRTPAWSTNLPSRTVELLSRFLRLGRAKSSKSVDRQNRKDK